MAITSLFANTIVDAPVCAYPGARFPIVGSCGRVPLAELDEAGMIIVGPVLGLVAVPVTAETAVILRLRYRRAASRGQSSRNEDSPSRHLR
jgi:hypothetical protein